MTFDSESESRSLISYKCNCVNGKCVGCGECCSDFLPVTDQEVKRMKQYARKHNLKEHRHNYPFAVKDLTCPFRNEETKKCDVYEVRPLICRSFICSKMLKQAEVDRDLIAQKRDTKSIRYEIFGSDDNLDLLFEAKMALAMLMTERRS